MSGHPNAPGPVAAGHAVRTLRVAVDATAVPPRLTGAGVYVARMLRSLAARDDVRVLAFVAPASAAALQVGVHQRRIAGAGTRAGRIAWTQLRAGRAAAATGAQLLHGVHYELPLHSSVPQVVTVHDLSLLTHPEWHERAKVHYFRWAIPRALARARRVLCVSATTASDLVALTGIDPGTVDVTPLGTDLSPAPADRVAALRARLGLHAPYVLGLGTLEPRKDTPALVRAFASLAPGIPHDLVLAGLAGWGADAVTSAVRASGVAARVHLPGYVDDADKAALFSGADAFCYPSRYEGFGLPVLEAMACGTPVVTTRGGALPEVTGPDGALLVEPGDVEGLAAALERCLFDGTARERLVAEGRRRAAAFTWERCAAATAGAYQKAVRAAASR